MTTAMVLFLLSSLLLLFLQCFYHTTTQPPHPFCPFSAVWTAESQGIPWVSQRKDPAETDTSDLREKKEEGKFPHNILPYYPCWTQNFRDYEIRNLCGSNSGWSQNTKTSILRIEASRRVMPDILSYLRNLVVICSEDKVWINKSFQSHTFQRSCSKHQKAWFPTSTIIIMIVCNISNQEWAPSYAATSQGHPRLCLPLLGGGTGCRFHLTLCLYVWMIRYALNNVIKRYVIYNIYIYKSIYIWHMTMKYNLYNKLVW